NNQCQRLNLVSHWSLVLVHWSFPLMPDFAYIARDLTGQKVSGTISATTEREVLSILSGKSLFPVQVKADKAAVVAGSNLKLSGQMMATVDGQLAALLRSGVPPL